jgi:hypothetical protein
MKAQLRRFLLCWAALIATAAATWVNPPAADNPAPAFLRGSPIEPAPQAKAAAAPQISGEPALGSGMTVVRWEFSPTRPGRPVYLSMTLDGTQAAIDRM